MVPKSSVAFSSQNHNNNWFYFKKKKGYDSRFFFLEKTCQPDLKLHKTLNRVDRWQPLNVDAKALCRHPHNEKKKKTPIYYIHTQIYLISTLTTFILLFVQLLLDVLHIGARRIKYMSSIFLFITFFFPKTILIQVLYCVQFNYIC